MTAGRWGIPHRPVPCPLYFVTQPAMKIRKVPEEPVAEKAVSVAAFEGVAGAPFLTEERA